MRRIEMGSAIGMALNGSPTVVGDALVQAGLDPTAVAVWVNRRQMEAANEQIDAKHRA